MFNLDINFLNDRPDLKPGAASARSNVRSSSASAGGNQSPLPLYIGAGAALALLGLAGGAFGYFTWQKGDLEAKQTDLDSKLGTIEAKRKELQAANKEVTAAEGEIKALATVFNQIKPWSAMSQDLRERLPPGVQIFAIVQAPTGTAPTGGNAVYSPDIRIAGEAVDFDQVNDLLVILKKSNFLKPEETRIIETARTDPQPLPAISLPKPVTFPVKPGEAQQEPTNNNQIKLPGKVKFVVQSKLSDIPTSELLRELDRKGAVGLVTRVEALKSKGVKP